VPLNGPPTGAGRWSLLPLAEGDTTVRAKALGELLLERHGVVTRGAVVSEGVRGGFALAYKVLSGFEETGRARRGYFVDGLGAAQFATAATVDRLRSHSLEPDAPRSHHAVSLSATDPANAYGAALPWPGSAGDEADVDEAPTPGGKPRKGHRPGRKAGAVVTLVDGELVLYVEKGGKSVLTFDDDPAALAAAAASYARTVRDHLGKARIDRINGKFAIGTTLGDLLVAEGFAPHPSGLRLRA
jgi:ATP-dependent Lhr-like helicase